MNGGGTHWYLHLPSMDATFMLDDRLAAVAGWEDDSDTTWAEFQQLVTQWTSRAHRLPDRQAEAGGQGDSLAWER